MKKTVFQIIILLLLISCQKEVYYTVSTAVNPKEAGTVSVSPAEPSVLEGSSITFTAQPKGDYVFTGWSGSFSGTENPKTVTVISDMVVTANFTLKEYPLTVRTEGDGTVSERVISTKTDYSFGTVVELTAKAADHWFFDHWEGDLTSKENPAKITVSSAKTVKAVFVKKMYNLTVEVEGEGSVSEAVLETKSGSYQEGTVIELTANPANLWEFDHWEGGIDGSDNPSRITITSPTSIKAVFAKVGLSRNGTANCYIVNKPGSYSFPVVRGNSDELIENVVSAKLVWETYNENREIVMNELISDLHYENGVVSFYAAMLEGFGNALIAVCDKDGSVLWSWHIWLCHDYDAEQSAIRFPNSGIIAMDRNLGATEAIYGTRGCGMLYQWGRKDPFFISQWDWAAENSMSTIGKSPVISAEAIIQTGGNNLKYATEHPETFITNEYSPYDWYCTDKASQNNSLWNDNDKKTIYDPCPPGWKVPNGGQKGFWATESFDKYSLQLPIGDTDSYPMCIKEALEMKWWSTDKHGRLYLPANNWFSMPGCKRYYDGGQTADDGYGAYWTNHTDDIFSTAFYFAFYGDVYADLPNFRSYAYAIRCVKE